jgi:DNA-binding NarL/FixJ family response regulator
MPDQREVNLLLIDDQPAVRHGLRMLCQLEPGVVVIGEAGTALEGLALAEIHKPDVVIMDVEMPGLDGIAATSALIAKHSTCVVIILTIHDDSFTRTRAMAAGAWAFVQKGRPEDLQNTFRQALLFVAPQPY